MSTLNHSCSNWWYLVIVLVNRSVNSLFPPTLQILAHYTANLTAFETLGASETNVRTLQEVQNGRLPFAVISQSSVWSWLATNSDPSYRSMLSYAVPVASYDEGYALLQSGDVMAFFSTSPGFDYYLTQVGERYAKLLSVLDSIFTTSIGLFVAPL